MLQWCDWFTVDHKFEWSFVLLLGSSTQVSSDCYWQQVCPKVNLHLHCQMSICTFIITGHRRIKPCPHWCWRRQQLPNSATNCRQKIVAVFVTSVDRALEVWLYWLVMAPYKLSYYLLLLSVVTVHFKFNLTFDIDKGVLYCDILTTSDVVIKTEVHIAPEVQMKEDVRLRFLKNYIVRTKMTWFSGVFYVQRGPKVLQPINTS